MGLIVRAGWGHRGRRHFIMQCLTQHIEPRLNPPRGLDKLNPRQPRFTLKRKGTETQRGTQTDTEKHRETEVGISCEVADDGNDNGDHRFFHAL